MDDEVFVSALRVLVKEIPNHFERWDVALDCLDLSLCKRRESRSNVVLGFVRLLYLHSSQMMSDSVGLALLAMANTVLLKYPRVRGEMFAPLSSKKQDDDEVRRFSTRHTFAISLVTHRFYTTLTHTHIHTHTHTHNHTITSSQIIPLSLLPSIWILTYRPSLPPLTPHLLSSLPSIHSSFLVRFLPHFPLFLFPPSFFPSFIHLLTPRLPISR